MKSSTTTKPTSPKEIVLWGIVVTLMVVAIFWGTRVAMDRDTADRHRNHERWIAKCLADHGHPVIQYFPDGSPFFKECRL